MSLTLFERGKQFRFDRPITSYRPVQERVGYVLSRFRKVLHPERVASLRYLNLGCGPNMNDKFVNMDRWWRPGLDVCCDITEGLPLSSQSVDGIFTEHCLEHITMDQCRAVLKECRRLLRPGGTLRIVIPDAAIFAKLYIQALSGEEVQFPYSSEYPSYTPMMHVNRIFREHGHQFAYDAETLAMVVKQAGFDQTALKRFREGKDAMLLLDHESRAVESMYLEAYTSNE